MKKVEKLLPLDKLLLTIMYIILAIILIGCITFFIYTLIVYGGKSASEIPGWVWWLWFK